MYFRANDTQSDRTTDVTFVNFRANSSRQCRSLVALILSRYFLLLQRIEQHGSFHERINLMIITLLGFSVYFSPSFGFTKTVAGQTEELYPPVGAIRMCNIRPNTTQRRSVEKVPINDWQASVTLILLVFHRLDLAS